MARVVLQDHILFRECIPYLREDLFLKENRLLDTDKRTFSCVCTTFHITQPWDLGDFLVRPSRQVELSSDKKALISFVENPTWIDKSLMAHPLLFSEVLSCLISFVSLLPTKSPRTSYRLEFESINSVSDEAINDIALTLPFIDAGSGYHKSHLGYQKEKEIIEELKELISILKNIDEKLYPFVLEVIRLIHLSIFVKRDDFGLSYLLLVSAIESVAQRAIKRKDVRETPSEEKKWEDIAKSDDEFKELLNAYKKMRGTNNYLSKRFVKFILKFCPPDEWENIVVYRYNDLDEDWGDFNRGSQHPTLMTTDEIQGILEKAYNHRSRFVHNGTQPPHLYPDPAINKFFEVISSYNNGLFEEQIIPSHGLMLGIAKHSIMKWLRTKIEH